MENVQGVTSGPVQKEKSAPADLAAHKPETIRKPGEMGFTILLILFGAAGFYFAMDLTSETLSSPSVFPKIASTIIMACGVVSLIKSLRRAPTKEKILRFLLPRDVTVMLILLIIYCFVLPYAGFIATSFGFLALGMIYLHRGKKIPQSVLYSALVLAALVLLFRYVFLVILP